jgi:hypothetical protein
MLKDSFFMVNGGFKKRFVIVLNLNCQHKGVNGYTTIRIREFQTIWLAK